MKTIYIFLLLSLTACSGAHVPDDAGADADMPTACEGGEPAPWDCPYIEHHWSRLGCAGPAPCRALDDECTQYFGSADTCAEAEAALGSCCR